MQAWMPRAARTLRASSLGRVAAVGVVTAMASTAFAVRTFPASAVVVVRPTSVAPHVAPAPRVLMIGDSVMDQQGQHAEFVLRQAGIDAKADALWGSSVLTRQDYDYGKSKPNGGWLKRAADDIASFDPDVVAVYLNHNYWPPYPRDAAGHLIDGPAPLSSPSGQAM